MYLTSVQQYFIQYPFGHTQCHVYATMSCTYTSVPLLCTSMLHCYFDVVCSGVLCDTTISFCLLQVISDKRK